MWNKIKYFRSKNLLIYVTSKCNHRCLHCFYLNKINIVEDRLSIENIKKILPQFPKFKYLLFSGGEPFLREDLKELAFLLVETLDVKKLQINTNGSLTDRIHDFCKEYLEREKIRPLRIQLTLLGPSHIHDLITGVPGSFNKLNGTVGCIKEFTKKYNNFEAIFCVPIMRLNCRAMQFLFKYAFENNIQIKFSPLMSVTKTVYTEKRLCNLDFIVNDESLFLNNVEYSDFLSNLEKESKKYPSAFWPEKDRWRNHAYLFVRSGRSAGECHFRKNNLVIYPNGDYSICELLKVIGNIIDDNGNFMKNKERLRDLVGASKNCFCAHWSYLSKYMHRLFIRRKRTVECQDEYIKG